MNAHQRYLIEEFAEEYLENRMARRDLLRRVLLITGSVPTTASVLIALGCGGSSAPAADATAAATPTTPLPTPPPAAGPGVTVQPNDPAIVVEEVKYRGPASDIMAYLARPRQGGPFAALVVIHENRGLVEHIRDVARRYAREGFVALAVDLVSRAGGTGPDAAANTGHLGRTPPEDHVADLVASVAYLKSLPYVRADAIGATGFCFGGGYTFELAIASADIKAAVPYYGTVRSVDDLAKTRAAVLVIYAANDARVTNQRPQVEERLQAAGKTYAIRVYPASNHAFFNDTGGNYNPDAARDAWTATLEWFRRHLGA